METLGPRALKTKDRDLLSFKSECAREISGTQTVLIQKCRNRHGSGGRNIQELRSARAEEKRDPPAICMSRLDNIKQTDEAQVPLHSLSNQGRMCRVSVRKYFNRVRISFARNTDQRTLPGRGSCLSGQQPQTRCDIISDMNPLQGLFKGATEKVL